jgi:hypothetical protein
MADDVIVEEAQISEVFSELEVVHTGNADDAVMNDKIDAAMEFDTVI